MDYNEIAVENFDSEDLLKPDVKASFVTILRGAKIAALAKETGIPDSTIRNYLKGHEPTIGNADKILTALSAEITLGKKHP